jgi:hypothetical protein
VKSNQIPEREFFGIGQKDALIKERQELCETFSFTDELSAAK